MSYSLLFKKQAQIQINYYDEVSFLVYVVFISSILESQANPKNLQKFQILPLPSGFFDWQVLIRNICQFPQFPVQGRSFISQFISSLIFLTNIFTEIWHIFTFQSSECVAPKQNNRHFDIALQGKDDQPRMDWFFFFFTFFFSWNLSFLSILACEITLEAPYTVFNGFAVGDFLLVLCKLISTAE